MFFKNYHKLTYIMHSKVIKIYKKFTFLNSKKCTKATKQELTLKKRISTKRLMSFKRQNKKLSIKESDNLILNSSNLIKITQIQIFQTKSPNLNLKSKLCILTFFRELNNCQSEKMILSSKLKVNMDQIIDQIFKCKF